MRFHRLHPSTEATGVLRVTLGWVFKASKADEHIHQEVFCALLKLLTPQSEIGVVSGLGEAQIEAVEQRGGGRGMWQSWC